VAIKRTNRRKPTKAKRRAAALKGWRKRRRNRTKRGMRRKTARRAYGKRRNALAVKLNRKRRRSSTRRRRSIRLNPRRNALAVKLNRKRRSTRKGGVRRTARRAYSRRRRNTSVATAFNNKLTAPLQKIVGKLPVVGKVAKEYAGPIVMGAAVGGVAYGTMTLMQKFAPEVVEKVGPVKFTLTGVVAATALKYIPVGDKKLRSQLAVGALLVGGALDMYRLLSARMGDLGDSEYLELEGAYGNEYIELEGAYGALSEDGSLYSPEAGYGDGGAYDVVPMDGIANSYGSSELGDAYASPADLSVAEGEAALAGPDHWRRAFGHPPHVKRRIHGGYGPLAGRHGHRWGWLIRLVGFDRFQKLASLPPESRVALVAKLKAQAQQMADEQIAAAQVAAAAAHGAQAVASSAPSGETAGLAMDMSGLAMEVGDLGTPLFAGAM